jgi:SAM-dependent methyltransferase
VASVASTFYGADLSYIHQAGFSDSISAAAPALASLLRAAGIRAGRVVDLGCGAGILARELVALGYDVVGIDASADMLRLARAEAPGASFVHARAEHAAFSPCRAVFAIGETLSYLPAAASRSRSVRTLFARIARALEAGGIFVFDAIVRGSGPPMTYRTWRAGADWAVLTDVREDPRSRTVTRHITTLRAARRGEYRRSEELHRLAVFDRQTVERWLRAAGFTVTARRRYGRVPLPPRRLAFVARR